jgi:spore maturation protein CgeB
VRLLFLGPLWQGSTALQRMVAFERSPGLEVIGVDSMERVGRASFMDRLRHRIRYPADHHRLNQRALEVAEATRPDCLFVDSTRLLTRRTLGAMRRSGVQKLVFYSPDDVSAAHNSSRQLEGCDREWDLFFTTKTFCVPELAARGVRIPKLVGNAYDPDLHRPYEEQDVGPEFEAWDTVFVGTCESDRLRSLNHLAEFGTSVVVYGSKWDRSRLHASISLRPAVYSHDYARALHTGKVALGFLRKLNRDRVTTRSVEVPAIGRAMVAEKTSEHDDLFVDGMEYLSFGSDDELLGAVRSLLSDEKRRAEVAHAGRMRCLASGYSTVDRAGEMIRAIKEVA